ncbi:unnamed protein product [Linum trigynum]|uniref:Histone-binding protein RBBP4-like N-terminal domain-containing protein n=1 Tax=Linum trigynum TaxID=586398 RepID=A0AAV2DZV0_9ROSI
MPSKPMKVCQPGVDKLEDGEELECDPSAYNSLHAFHIGWPCLRLLTICLTLTRFLPSTVTLVVQYLRVGLVRTDFPHTVYLLSGTQVENPAWNSIGIFKVSNIFGQRRELVPRKNVDGESDMDVDNSDSDDDSDDGDAGGSKAPSLQVRRVAHGGCVHRIRAMTQSPHLCATWSDFGHVHIWDFSSQVNGLAESKTKATAKDPPVVN